MVFGYFREISMKKLVVITGASWEFGAAIAKQLSDL